MCDICYTFCGQTLVLQATPYWRATVITYTLVTQLKILYRPKPIHFRFKEDSWVQESWISHMHTELVHPLLASDQVGFG